MVRTYAEAGVDIDAKGAQVRALVQQLRFRRRGLGAPWGPKGHFAGFVDMGRTALGVCTDSVGTKVLVANEMRRWDTVGVDCVAANVNDMVCAGAEPIAFVDYLAVDTQDPELPRQVGVGLDAGAREANVTIVGGELAVLPELLDGFDLTGTCVGVVEKTKLIDGRGIRPGDRIIGVPSSGFHCNGFTLIRRVLRENAVTVMDPVPKDGRPWGEALLEPTRIYVRPVLAAIRKAKVTGLANITGGGLRNLVRLKPKAEFRITDPLPVPPGILADSLGEKAALRKSGAMGEAKKEGAPEAVDPKVRLARVACGAVLLAVAGTEFVSVVLTRDIVVASLWAVFGFVALATGVYLYKGRFTAWGTAVIVDAFAFFVALVTVDLFVIAALIASFVVLYMFRLPFGVGAWKIESAKEDGRSRALIGERTRNAAGTRCPKCGADTLG